MYGVTFFFITGLLLFAIGYLAQTTGLCLVRGVNQALDRHPQFLLSILLSGAFGWVSLLLAEVMQVKAPFHSYSLAWTALLGGVLFGVGAAINVGCGVSTLSKLSRGDTRMMATVTGWVIGWIGLASIADIVPTREMLPLPAWHFPALAGLSALLLITVLVLRRSHKTLWFSMFAIGLMAGLAFLFEPRWTPSRYLSDASLAFWDEDMSRWPSVDRSLPMLLLLTGMAVAAAKNRSFFLILTSVKTYGRYLFAGTLMGIGASLAGGGNDSQLLLALPSFSVTGFIIVLCMLFGIAASVIFQRYWRSRHIGQQG